MAENANRRTRISILNNIPGQDFTTNSNKNNNKPSESRKSGSSATNKTNQKLEKQKTNQHETTIDSNNSQAKKPPKKRETNILKLASHMKKMKKRGQRREGSEAGSKAASRDKEGTTGNGESRPDTTKTGKDENLLTKLDLESTSLQHGFTEQNLTPRLFLESIIMKEKKNDENFEIEEFEDFEEINVKYEAAYCGSGGEEDEGAVILHLTEIFVKMGSEANILDISAKSLEIEMKVVDLVERGREEVPSRPRPLIKLINQTRRFLEYYKEPESEVDLVRLFSPRTRARYVKKLQKVFEIESKRSIENYKKSLAKLRRKEESLLKKEEKHAMDLLKQREIAKELNKQKIHKLTFAKIKRRREIKSEEIKRAKKSLKYNKVVVNRLKQQPLFEIRKKKFFKREKAALEDFKQKKGKVFEEFSPESVRKHQKWFMGLIADRGNLEDEDDEGALHHENSEHLEPEKDAVHEETNPGEKESPNK